MESISRDVASSRCKGFRTVTCGALTVATLALSALVATHAGAQNTYQNPILNEQLADPTTLNDNGQLYIYGTGKASDGGFVPMTKLINPNDFNSWTSSVGVLNLPSWSDGGAWAPHVVRNPNPTALPSRKFLMFLTLQGKAGNDVVVDGTHYTIAEGSNCMAVAYAATPEGPFTTQERPVNIAICNTGSGADAAGKIDPFFYVDDVPGKGDGAMWLYWGSFHLPLLRQKVVFDSGTIKLGGPLQTLQNIDYATGNVVDMKGTNPNDANVQYTDMLEGSWVFYRAPYYYLMTSGYQCCKPTESPKGYAVVVWRTTSLKDNTPWERMPESLGEDGTVLRSSDRANAIWESPGHNSLFLDGQNKWWIVYHARKRDGAAKRLLMMDKLQWDNYWPYLITDNDAGTPSEGTMTGPVVPLPQG